MILLFIGALTSAHTALVELCPDSQCNSGRHDTGQTADMYQHLAAAINSGLWMKLTARVSD